MLQPVQVRVESVHSDTLQSVATRLHLAVLLLLPRLLVPLFIRPIALTLIKGLGNDDVSICHTMIFN